MKKLLIFILILLFPAVSFASAYSFSRSIVVNSGKVPSAQTHFPMNFSGTYPYLATVSNGGKVQNANGYDVAFSSDSVCGTKLNWDSESYNAVTGAVSYFIDVSSLNNGSTIYICYGAPSISTDQSNPTSVWSNAGYAAVYHLSNGVTPSYADSTTNANNMTASSTPTAIAGQMDGAVSFAKNGQFATTTESSSLQYGTNSFSYSMWLKTSALSGAQGLLTMVNNNTTTGFRFVGSTNDVQARITDGTHAISGTLSGSVSDSNWHYLVVTVDRVGNKMTTYVDGTAINAGDSIATVTGSITDATALLCVNGITFSGVCVSSVATQTVSFDEVHMSSASTLLSANWIKTEYNNQNSPSTFYTVGGEYAINALWIQRGVNLIMRGVNLILR